MATPKLYSYEESGNCYKATLLISLLGIDLEQIEIDYVGKEQRTPPFLAINPRGTVPALALDDRSLTDSAAILVYLAGAYPDRNSSQAPSSYWPNDVLKQATIMDWLAFDASWISLGLCQARYILSFIRTQKHASATLMEKELGDAQERGRKSLDILQAHLEKHQWLADQTPTIADVCVFPYVALAPMGDVSLDPYPAVKNWIERIKKLDGFMPIKGLDDPLYRRRG